MNTWHYLDFLSCTVQIWITHRTILLRTWKCKVFKKKHIYSQFVSQHRVNGLSTGWLYLTCCPPLHWPSSLPKHQTLFCPGLWRSVHPCVLPSLSLSTSTSLRNLSTFSCSFISQVKRDFLVEAFTSDPTRSNSLYYSQTNIIFFLKK